MAIYPEDDDLDLERQLERADRDIDSMARDMMMMEERRTDLQKVIKAQKIDPLVAKSLQLAHEAGQARGVNESLSRKIENLVSRIAVRDQEIERTNDRDDWKARALAAEATIERSKKRRKR
jgi:hypothetical protein